MLTLYCCSSTKWITESSCGNLVFVGIWWAVRRYRMGRIWN